MSNFARTIARHKPTKKKEPKYVSWDDKMLPDPGMRFLSPSYSQLEMRLMGSALSTLTKGQNE